jgi:hypothetical protein
VIIDPFARSRLSTLFAAFDTVAILGAWFPRSVTEAPRQAKQRGARAKSMVVERQESG